MRVSDPAGPAGRPFAKGHGTGNDFVLLLDPADDADPTPGQVRALCERRTGIGADGVLRAVRARHVRTWSGAPDDGLWFMDYRNADGSVAEMCGNGVRVFVLFLLEQGLVQPRPDGLVPVATRAGLRHAWVLPNGRVRVAMGEVTVGARDVRVDVSTRRPADGTEADPAGPAAAPGAGRSTVALDAYRADVGNPHAVCFVDDAGVDLDALDLRDAPHWIPASAFPAGVNVEFVRRVGPRHVAMRVHERGSGETLSCGTGTCAVAAATAAADGDGERPATYRVDVPGGTVEVELWTDETYLTGPAVIVAHGTTTLA